MRNRRKPPTSLLAAAVVAALSVSACSAEDASPTDRACDRLLALGHRVRTEGELQLPEYRQAFAAAWTDAATDPQSAIADPIDRAVGIIDRTTNGYLLPAEQQHLANQLAQIEGVCRGRP